MAAQVDSKISRLLRCKGLSNIRVENRLKDKILSILLGHEEDTTPGIKIKFLEYKKQETDYGEWNEYNVLIEATRYKDTPEYLSYIFKCLEKIISHLTGLVNIDSIGLQEVDASQPGSYYFLIYILSDGKNKTNEETEDC